MTLEFTKQGDIYVAEFTADAPFSLHVERDRVGYIEMLQNSVTGGKYDTVREFKVNAGDPVFDFDSGDFLGTKFIRIESEVLPTFAAVTTSGEVTEIKSQSKEVEVTANGTMDITPDAGFAYLNSVKVKTNVAQSGEGGGSTGGGGSASGNDYLYIDLSKVEVSGKSSLVALSIMAKVDTGDGYMITPSGSLLEFGNMSNAAKATKAIAISPSMKFISFGEESTIEQTIQTMGIDLSPALITEEEFYTL